MEEVTQVHCIIQKLLRLHLLSPFKQGYGLLIDNSDPLIWIFRSLPLSLPALWHSSFEQLGGLFLTLGCQHFGALQNLGDCCYTLMDDSKCILGNCYFHVHEGFHWIGCIQVFLSDRHFFKSLPLVEIVPHLADRCQTLRPFLLVKAELLGTHSSELLELSNHKSTVDPLHTSIDVCRQSKHGWGIEFWHLVDDALIISDVTRLRHWYDTRKRLLSFHGRILEHASHVGSQHPQIEIIINPATINCIFKDTVDLLPLRASTSALCLNSRQGELSCLEITK